jgi:hypothetical protein
VTGIEPAWPAWKAMAPDASPCSRAADPEWAQRRRLLRGYERLRTDQFVRMWNGLTDADPSGKILTAWIRLPQPGQPAPPGTVRMHPAQPSGHRLLRVISPSNSKSRHRSIAELDRLSPH